MINIVKYSSELKSDWNNFTKQSKNGHFIFIRDYLEYHSDRFEDFSLLIFNDKNKLISVLPANIQDDSLYSHQGLTFGGFIIDDKMGVQIMLSIFDEIKVFLKKNSISKLIYKCIPYIYHVKPSEEDKYALFRNNAILTRRDITSTIDLSEPVRYSQGRKWIVNKAKKENFEISLESDFSGFWRLLNKTLQEQHNTEPTHSLSEIIKLSEAFPNNIKLYVCKYKETLLSGTVIFENNNIVHTQYLASSQAGRKVGALDFLLDYLIKNIYNNKKYFDFGISNENEGKYLNTGLVSQKEGFGARSVAHDFYELSVDIQ